jgi:hypothetical protein
MEPGPEDRLTVSSPSCLFGADDHPRPSDGKGSPVTAMLADRVMKARRDSACTSCRRPIRRGQQIARVGHRWEHIEHVLERIRRHGGQSTDDAETPMEGKAS